jgi:hypothetical protein
MGTATVSKFSSFGKQEKMKNVCGHQSSVQCSLVNMESGHMFFIEI